MKITLWYESHNAHERLVAKVVAARFTDARLVDVSTWTAMRDRKSESGWPDRHVRAFPCLVFDTDDGLIELERVEEVVSQQTIGPKEADALEYEQDVEAALEKARQRQDVPGGARPIEIALLKSGPDVPGDVEEGGGEDLAMANAPAKSPKSAKPSKSGKRSKS